MQEGKNVGALPVVDENVKKSPRLVPVASLGK